MQLIFATNNLHKLEEVTAIVPDKYTIRSLKDLGFEGDIPEPYETIEENAIGKARFIYEKFGVPCFADDTGLEVEALNGQPGVYSARYAGENCSFSDNVIKLLKELNGISNRKACFRTIVAFIDGENQYVFEGRIDGTISTKPSGEKGFGYDPLFIPNGYSTSFAEMSAEIKNSISHRFLAVKKFVDFLK